MRGRRALPTTPPTICGRHVCVARLLSWLPLMVTSSGRWVDGWVGTLAGEQAGRQATAGGWRGRRGGHADGGGGSGAGQPDGQAEDREGHARIAEARRELGDRRLAPVTTQGTLPGPRPGPARAPPALLAGRPALPGDPPPAERRASSPKRRSGQRTWPPCGPSMGAWIESRRRGCRGKSGRAGERGCGQEDFRRTGERGYQIGHATGQAGDGAYEQLDESGRPRTGCLNVRLHPRAPLPPFPPGAHPSCERTRVEQDQRSKSTSPLPLPACRQARTTGASNGTRPLPAPPSYRITTSNTSRSNVSTSNWYGSCWRMSEGSIEYIVDRSRGFIRTYAWGAYWRVWERARQGHAVGRATAWQHVPLPAVRQAAKELGKQPICP